MDFVKELGLTLLAGAFAMLGIEVIAYCFLNRRPFTSLARKLTFEGNELTGNEPDADKSTGSRTGKNEKDQTFTVVVFVLIAFTAGIFLENLSLKYVDSNPVLKRIPAHLVGNSVAHSLALPTKTDDRVRALIGDLTGPTSLGRDLAANNGFGMHGSPTDLTVQKWINQGMQGDSKDDPGPDAIMNSIGDLYFIAKNTAYAHPQYYDELRRIQARYEFAVSLAMLSFASFWVAIVIGVVSFLKRRSAEKKDKNGGERPHELRNQILVIGSFALIYLLSLSALAREADGFNRRVFGYFSTDLISEKRKPATPSPSPTASPCPSPEAAPSRTGRP